MATSGSYNYTINRDNLIKDALIDLGAVSQEDTVSSAINEHANRQLNGMLKAYQSKGLRLWKAKRASLLLQKNTRSYSLGPSGDHFFLESEFVETTMRVAGVANDTILEVTSTTGMAANDYIAIELDSGSMQFTTISSVTDSNTLVIPATGLTSAVAATNVIYTYTTKAQRPLQIIQAWIRDENDVDRPVNIVSREEYYRYGDKFTAGSINSIYYDPQLTNGTLFVYSPESVVSNTLEMLVYYPIEDMDAATNDFDCPAEWFMAIKYNLEWALFPAYGTRREQKDTIKELAAMYLDDAMSFDKEHTSIFIQPGDSH